MGSLYIYIYTVIASGRHRAKNSQQTVRCLLCSSDTDGCGSSINTKNYPHDTSCRHVCWFNVYIQQNRLNILTYFSSFYFVHKVKILCESVV